MAERKEAKGGEVTPKERDMGHRIRILSTDIDSTLDLVTGLTRIMGVGYSLSKAIVIKLGMDPKKKLVDLTDQEIDTIENAISNPASLKVPDWMLNRRKDMDTGKDLHLNTSDLSFAKKSDLDLMGEIKSYKGLRLAKGLKVRGQRTASTGRGRSAVGVQRKKK